MPPKCLQLVLILLTALLVASNLRVATVIEVS